MVVTGREGQVVRSLIERALGKEIEVVCLGRPEFDLAAPPARIQSAIEAAKPDVLVSAAAYTKVDKAEAEPELAFAINRDGACALAMAASELEIPLIHLSTDYVFDGTKPSPYVEEDPAAPGGVYGASKLAGGTPCCRRTTTLRCFARHGSTVRLAPIS
jgi:dTDP-4-dehydrorhamnose reductase